MLHRLVRNVGENGMPRNCRWAVAESGADPASAMGNIGLVREAHFGIVKATILGAHQIFRNPDLILLECLRKDPSIPMSKLTAMEEAIYERRGIS